MTNRPMAAAASDAPVLSLENLSVRFATSDGDVQAVRDVSLGVRGGECLGIVGESGSGKSQTFLATLARPGPRARRRFGARTSSGSMPPG